MSFILNLTQHAATPAQAEEGVIELSSKNKQRLVKLLTFDEAPTYEDLSDRALRIVWLVQDVKHEGSVMIGGAPYFMAPLEKALKKAGFTSCYSFSKRISRDVANVDGTVTKLVVFEHSGFVPVINSIK